MPSQVAQVEQVVQGVHVTDGAGVHLNRIIGSHELDMVDPFVLLDEFRSDDPDDYIAGFPWHPHRGIETITYMVRGAFRHEDSRGGGGVLTDGEVQWMTAGRGILHQEMPEMKEGHLWGYQLWLNLAARDKMVPPRYQHLTSENMPRVEREGISVKVIAGVFEGHRGPAETTYPIEYLDVTVGRGGRFEQPQGDGMNVALYVHSGSVVVDPDGEARQVAAGSMVILGPGARVEVEGADKGSGFLYLAGTPHREPVARGGPFVMNTREEIRQAWEDYQSGRLF